MWFILAHPELIARTCEECQKTAYDDRPNEPLSSKTLTDKRTGLPMARPSNIPTPCDRCPRTAHLPPQDRTRFNALEITDLTYQIYQHYRECRAVGVFPTDGLVRYHASIIRGIEDAIEKREREEQMIQLATLANRRS